MFGTHALWRHNTTDLSFSFSHILATTRDDLFGAALKDADMNHVPQKVMEEAGITLRFGLVKEGKEGFIHATNPAQNSEKNQDDNVSDDSDSQV
jgi:hypothetical protein